MWDRITVRLPRKSVMASRAYRPGKYFRRSVLAKSFEQSSEQSEDNSVDISRKDLDDDEPVVDESMRESRSTRKDVEEDLPGKKSKKSQGKRKTFFASESATKRRKTWSWTSEAVEILLRSTLKNSKPSVSLTAWTSRPIYLQCMRKYADAWRWILPTILALTLFRNQEKNLRI